MVEKKNLEIVMGLEKKNLEKYDKIELNIKTINSNIQNIQKMEIFDETPFRIDKIMNMYRWKVIIKARLNTQLANSISYMIKNIKTDKDTNISVDLNPFNI